MTSRIIYVALLIWVLPALSSAQDSPLADYDWEDSPVVHEVPEDLQDEEEVVLMRKMFHEFLFGDDDNLYEYKTYHTVRRVNSQDAIEDNQEIYLNV